MLQVKCNNGAALMSYLAGVLPSLLLLLCDHNIEIVEIAGTIGKLCLQQNKLDCLLLFRCFRIAPKKQKCQIVTLLLHKFPVLAKVVDGLMLLLIRHINDFPVEAADCLQNFKPTERSLAELQNIKLAQILDCTNNPTDKLKICGCLEAHLQQIAFSKAPSHDHNKPKSSHASVLQQSRKILDHVLKIKQQKLQKEALSLFENPKKRQKTRTKQPMMGHDRSQLIGDIQDIDVKRMQSELRRFINVRAERLIR